MITSIYAAILGFLYFHITMTVIRGRVKNQISLGSGDKNEIIHLVSAHSNFAAYVPFFLILLLLLELQHANFILLNALGVVFVIGRVLHYVGMKGERMNFKLRKKGMLLTMWPILIAIVACIIYPAIKLINLFQL